MQNKLLLTLMTAALFTAGCASTPAPSDKQAAEKAAQQAAADAKAKAATAEATAKAQAAIATAEKSRDAASAVGYEWRDTSSLIDDAKKAAAAGEYDKATTLANRAAREGELAVKQHAIETERLAKKSK